MYVEYICEKQNKYLTKKRAYYVLQAIENYYYLIKDNNNIESIYEPHLFKIFPLLRVKYIGNNNNIPNSSCKRNENLVRCFEA